VSFAPAVFAFDEENKAIIAAAGDDEGRQVYP
jgi:hypothetical protein